MVPVYTIARVCAVFLSITPVFCVYCTTISCASRSFCALANFSANAHIFLRFRNYSSCGVRMEMFFSLCSAHYNVFHVCSDNYNLFETFFCACTLFYAFAHLLQVFSRHADVILRLFTTSTYFLCMFVFSRVSAPASRIFCACPRLPSFADLLHVFVCACARFSEFGQLFLLCPADGNVYYKCFLPIITIFILLLSLF